MGISVQYRRGTTSDHSTFTGKVGEMTVDITKNVCVIHDGTTVGGWAMSRFDHTHAVATESVAGFLSAADKTKLDSISGGAIEYQTVQANGVAQNQRGILNVSANFAVTDDSAGNRTSVDLSTTGVSAGTYTKVTVNNTGRVTGATLLSAGDIPNITTSQITGFASAVQTTRLDQFANPTADVNLNSNKLINVATPVASTDAATKGYVDSTATGLTFKDACRAASAGTNINIAAPGTTIDSVSLNNGDRVLLKDQSDATTNGIYIFNGASTPMTRSLDANSSSEVNPGMFLLVTEGTLNADVGFVLATTGTITLGATNLSFVAFSSGGGSVTAGNGINVAGSVVSVKTVSASRIAVGSSGVDLATIGGLTPGTYNNLTVDAYGRISAITNTIYQVSNPNLTSIAAIVTNGFAARTGSGSYISRVINQGTGISVTNGDGVAGNVTIGMIPDSTYEQVNVLSNGTQTSTRSYLNFIAGSGITTTIVDNAGSNRCDITLAASGGGGGAPTTAQYVTLATNGSLTGERVLVVGSGLSLVDGGAGNNVTISFVTDLGTVP